jgi:hypothetical protein
MSSESPTCYGSWYPSWVGVLAPAYLVWGP